MHISRCRMISRISLRARDFLSAAALGVRTETLRLNRHFVNGVLLITFVLPCAIPMCGKELYEFLAVTKVDGLPPAPSNFGAVTGLVGPKNLDGLFGDFGSVENYVCKI